MKYLVIRSNQEFVNLIGTYEFHSNKECFNLHEVIENLVSNEKIDSLASA
jgi:hypothetical protein